MKAEGGIPRPESPESGEMVSRIGELRRQLARVGERFEEDHRQEIDAFRSEITEGLHEAFSQLKRDVAELTGGNALCSEILILSAEYIDWLQWTFWDLPYFAVALRPEKERFRRTVAACGLVYLAIRVLDDLVDRHFWYRGKQTTLLAGLTLRHRQGDRTEGLTVLTAFLLCFDGLSRLSHDVDPRVAQTLRRTVDSIRRTLIGMIMEESDREQWSPEFYQRLIELKNVEYSQALYAALDPEHSSPLYPFLRRYYALAQKLNDLQDYSADEARGQPNMVSIHRRSASSVRSEPGAAGEAPASQDSGLEAAEELLGRDFLDLAAASAELPPLESSIAGLKLGESLEEACRLGLFEAPVASDSADPDLPTSFDLSWDSNLEEILERIGPDALVEVACPVCDADGRKLVLRRQGFALHRCLDCFHIYVSPRLRDDLQTRIGNEVEPDEDTFLEVQRIYAESICRRLRDEARDRRLLDIGFGGGHLMHVAGAYGFEVFGIDASSRLVEAQRPFFGQRLETVVLDDAALPWGGFDVIVMSHVVEHLGSPGAVLKRVWEALNPEGLLYVAVPDMGSVQFKVLGKRWNVVNPLAHFQYFNQVSLNRLLADSGFEVIERVEHPPFREEVSPPWMKLVRSLGGNESGELAVLARKPRKHSADPLPGKRDGSTVPAAPSESGSAVGTEAGDG